MKTMWHICRPQHFSYLSGPVLFDDKSFRYQLCLVVSMLLLSLHLLFTFARGSWSGFVVALMCVMFLTLLVPTVRDTVRRSWSLNKLSLVVLFLLLFCVNANYLPNDGFKWRFGEYVVRFGIADQCLLDDVMLWVDAFIVGKEKAIA
jgi:hypothetical protein